jgi:hypothetical protein
MTKKLAALVSVLLLSGTAAVADSWTDKMKTLDADGSGTISRGEWNAGIGKLKLGTAEPEFSVLDKDVNTSVDADEWAAGEGITAAYSKSCKSADSSWCPCQNHPENPECQ